MMVVRDEHIAPVATVIVGDNEWLPERFRVVSSRLEPADIATIVLDDRSGDVGVVVGSRVKLFMGYREHGEVELFDGIVEKSEADTATVVLQARDVGAVRLDGVVAPMGFDTATPGVVLGYIAQQCGIVLLPEATAQLAALPTKKYYTLRRQTGMSATREVLSAWGLSWDVWCDLGGGLYVGVPQLTGRYLSEEVYSLEWGESILDLQLPQNGTGRIVTIGLPIQHSSQIIVDSPDFRGPALVDRVVWSHWPHSRTEVTWQPAI